MNKIGFYIATILISVILAYASPLQANDNMYPAGYNYISSYILSQQDLAVNDTLIIDRHFVNKESTTIHGLYFSDHLPTSDRLTIETGFVKLNGSEVSFLFKQESDGAVLGNHSSYYWIIDSPELVDNQKLTILPNDSIHIQIKAVPHLQGNYSLPMHTTVFQSNGNSFFAASDTLTFVVSSLCGDANGDGVLNVLDISYIINFLYNGGPEPNPFESGDFDSDGYINILDITYMIIYLYGDGKAPMCE